MKNGKIHGKAFLCFIMITTVAIAMFPQKATSQTTTEVYYTFDEVRVSLENVAIKPRGSLTTIASIGKLQAAEQPFWDVPNDGYADVAWGMSAMFTCDPNGNRITAQEAENYARANMLDELMIGDTLVQYKPYYFAFDWQTYTTVALPTDPSLIPTRNIYMQMNGREGFGPEDDVEPNNGWTPDASKRPLLVLEEAAPTGDWNKADPWMGYIINTVNFVPPENNLVTLNYAYASDSSFMNPPLREIDVSAIYDNFGGDESLAITPTFSVSLNPILSRTINIVRTTDEGETTYETSGIYSAIISCTVKKIDYGSVISEYASERIEYDSTLTGTPPVSNVDNEINAPIDLAPVSSRPAGASHLWTVDMTVGQYDRTIEPSFYNQAAQQLNTILPMYVGTENVYDPTNPNGDSYVSSNLNIIADAPTAINLKPTVYVQPNYKMGVRDVTATGYYVKFWDPREGVLGGDFYVDQPDIAVHSGLFEALPIRKLTVDNTFVTQRIVVKTIIATQFGDTANLMTSGDYLGDVTFYGINEITTSTPQTQSGGDTTDTGDVSFWDNVQNAFGDAGTAWNEFWDDAGGNWNEFWDDAFEGIDLFGNIDPGLVMTIVFVVIGIIAVVIVILVVRYAATSKKMPRISIPTKDRIRRLMPRRNDRIKQRKINPGR